jgi:hypothetical protein
MAHLVYVHDDVHRTLASQTAQAAEVELIEDNADLHG